MHKLTIETPRLLLRRLVGDDRDAFVRHLLENLKGEQVSRGAL